MGVAGAALVFIGAAMLFVPRIGIEIANRKGARRMVRVNPMTGVPEVQPLDASQEVAP